MFSPLILILYYHCITGQEQLRCWAKLYWWFFLKVFRWTRNLAFLGCSSLFIASWSGSDQGCMVVQGFGQGCSWAEDESSEAGATFTMLFSLSPWQQPISPWYSDRNPICVRGLARERLFSLQGCSLRKDESSLNFTMLLRLESLSFLSFSSSCWREYSSIVRSYSAGSWLLYPACLPDSWGFGFLRLGSLLWLLRPSWISWFPGLFMVLWFFMFLVVFRTLVIFRTLLVFRLSRQLYFIKNFYFFQSRAHQ